MVKFFSLNLSWLAPLLIVAGVVTTCRAAPR